MKTARIAWQTVCEHPRAFQTTHFHSDTPTAPRWCILCGLKLGSKRHQRIKEGIAIANRHAEEARTSGGWVWP